MHNFLRFFPVFASTLGVVLAVPLNVSHTTISPAPSPTCTEATTTALPPEQDCFYVPPNGWETKEPGAVLRHRFAPQQPFATDTVNYPAWNILYRTTDSNGDPTYAVTTAFAPKDISTPHAMVSFQFNYNSADVNESPSYGIYHDIKPKLWISKYLQHGWFVNLPDFEGPLAAFGAGHMAGYATLDSVRATLKMSQIIGMPRGADQGVRYAMYGYSGGAFATGWAAELQPTYAPDLHFEAAGLGGLFPNGTATLEKLSKLQMSNWAWSSNLRSVMIGLGTMHKKIREVITSSLGKPEWDWNTVIRRLPQEKEVSRLDLKNAVNTAINSPLVRNVLDYDTTLGSHGIPTMPLMFHRADTDQLSAPEDTQELKNVYCNSGASVFLHVHPNTWDDPHFREGLQACLSEDIQTFLATAFARRLYPGCGTDNRPWGDHQYGPIGAR
ncbi:hypothetical protein P154DRAFT_519942 [Amniculicola lignicola CBS 123094]|uniref:LIP-domain-containing protein n=1 Tax=Amniculicola lignicola CBS 123094 TaxID=1392246 RepID=A0A6A5WPT7_9PLEO|nr:hypothetical protein P154DRAFT_519942 [Amniculicola lignicola CBS 123094]